MSGFEVEQQRLAMAAANAGSLVDADDGMGAGAELKALSAAHESIDPNRRQAAPTMSELDVRPGVGVGEGLS